MDIFNEIGPLKAFLRLKKIGFNSIGFVPTMGALHQGHISLIEASRTENSITVCSIFVNPAQFNNPADLAKYPRTLESDIVLLEKANCDILFCPVAAVVFVFRAVLFGVKQTRISVATPLFAKGSPLRNSSKAGTS